ncbi:hypothetical protein, partial [Streptomyces sp. NPDC056689]|uniref:hypothetical protein n=1 Tax=Streptomyces sp. NPDC056689 TaxID=3345911 RepID=UPI00368CF126
VRSVERSAAACSASGISFTCTTIFIPKPYAGTLTTKQTHAYTQVTPILRSDPSRARRPGDPH